MENGGIWLNHFGFAFDPFEHLEASADPNLNRYLIANPGSAAATEDRPALFFSEPGGGKTALRIYAARAAWGSGGGHRAFPIHYYLPDFFPDHGFSHVERRLATFEDHISAILQAAARALFTGLAYSPRLFLKLETSYKKQIAAFVLNWLPQGRYLLRVLKESGSPDVLAAQLGNAYVLHQVPERALLELFCETWEELTLSEAPSSSPSIARAFGQFITLVTGPLGFRSVIVLLDGVDAFPELYQSPSYASDSLFSLLSRVKSWKQNNVFIKGFLPNEMQQPLLERMKGQWDDFQRVELEWTEENLVSLIRMRIWVATEGRFDALGAVSVPSLGYGDVETTLVRAAIPLPREILILVQRVLDEYARRAVRDLAIDRQIQQADVDRAIDWYRKTQPSASFNSLLA